MNRPPTLKTEHALARRSFALLREGLEAFIDVPVTNDLTLTIFEARANSWIEKVRQELEGIYEDPRIITHCLDALHCNDDGNGLLMAAAQFRPGPIAQKAAMLRVRLRALAGELKSLETQLQLFDAPVRPLTKEENAAIAQERIDQFNANLRKPARTMSAGQSRPALPAQALASKGHTAMAESSEARAVSRDAKEVFVIFGRNTDAYVAMVQFLKATGLSPKSFDRHSAELGANPSVDAIVSRAVATAKAVIVLVTPDEYVVLHSKYRKSHDRTHEKIRWGPRPNVIYEAGLAMASNRDGAVFVVLGAAELPSDISGIHVVHLTNALENRRLLFNKLKTIGCAVDVSSEDWQTPTLGGDFERCLPELPTVVDPLEPAGNN